jgi:phosphohistidine phosphatase
MSSRSGRRYVSRHLYRIQVMKRLILLRHAKAERSAPSGRDFDRPLSPRGLDDAARAGRRLAAAGLIPDLVLVSASVRTVQTWAQASAALPDAKVQTRQDLYNAAPDHLLAVAKAEHDAQTVMVIAHNPGIGALAYELAAAATLAEAGVIHDLAQGFPTAAAAAFELDDDRVGCLGLFLPLDDDLDGMTSQ